MVNSPSGNHDASSLHGGTRRAPLHSDNGEARDRPAVGAIPWPSSKKNIAQAGRDSWSEWVDKLEADRPGERVQLKPEIHKAIKAKIRPLKQASRVMRVGHRILTQREAQHVWPAYFAEQSSLAGPLTPAEILAKLDDRDKPAPIDAMLHDDVDATTCASDGSLLGTDRRRMEA